MAQIEGIFMSSLNRQKKAIKQNVSKMACDIFDELKKQVDKLPLRRRFSIAFKIVRGAW